jgi:hypothetical protein
MDSKLAMKAVNEALTALQTAKAQKSKPADISKASKALSTLRQTQTGTATAINVEKAASILCSLLVELKQVRHSDAFKINTDFLVLAVPSSFERALAACYSSIGALSTR